MAVLINRTQKNFTMISNSILRDKDLSLKDRGLLCTRKIGVYFVRSAHYRTNGNSV